MTKEIKRWVEQCLDADERLLFEERAAIREYHGNLPRSQAERLTYERMWQQFLAKGIPT